MAAVYSNSTITAAICPTAVTEHDSTSDASSEADHPQQPMLPHCPSPPQLSLVPPSAHHRGRCRSPRFVRLFRSICRTLPIFTPKCKLLSGAPCRLLSTSRFSAVAPSSSGIGCHSSVKTLGHDSIVRHGHNHLLTGTLFGYRKGRVSFSLQENSRCLPTVVFELAMNTIALLREMNYGMVRIALECEKRPPDNKDLKLLEESLWTMFCNGKKTGYGVRRETSEDDLVVMEMLKAVSMGAGVLPVKSDMEGQEGEMAYVRAGFEHIIGSRDSETLYMIGPEGGNGPELTIFFVRI